MRIILLVALCVAAVAAKRFHLRQEDDTGTVYYGVIGDNPNQVVASDWISCDTPYPGTTGEYETLRRIRKYCEIDRQECLVPCAHPSGLEIDFVGNTDLQDSTIASECLNLPSAGRFVRRGFYCANYDQTTEFSAAGMCRDSTGMWEDPDCNQYLMRDDGYCECPDVKVRYFCANTQAESDQYCEDRLAQIQQKREQTRKILRRMVKELADKHANGDHKMGRRLLERTLKAAVGGKEAEYDENVHFLSILQQSDDI